MFERFTERARQVVVLAQDEARRLGHPHIGTEHLLLGLLREEEGIAALVLQSLGLTIDSARRTVGHVAGAGEVVTTGQMPFTPQAKRTLELALREAIALDHNHIGTEHILLALVRVPEEAAVAVLVEANVDEVTVRNAVIEHLSAGPARSPEAPKPRSRGTWDYRLEDVADAETVSVGLLTSLGAEGWELAATLSTGHGIRLIFKRRA